jgi:hypothetical protein
MTCLLLDGVHPDTNTNRPDMSAGITSDQEESNSVSAEEPENVSHYPCGGTVEN